MSELLEGERKVAIYSTVIMRKHEGKWILEEVGENLSDSYTQTLLAMALRDAIDTIFANQRKSVVTCPSKEEEKEIMRLWSSYTGCKSRAVIDSYKVSGEGHDEIIVAIICW